MDFKQPGVGVPGYGNSSLPGQFHECDSRHTEVTLGFHRRRRRSLNSRRAERA
jgi:hypothetical protein